MKKGTHTKRALVMSVLSLVLCCSMLIGSTFAWFSDSATSTGNKIQSGTLELDLLMADNSNGTYSSINGQNAAIFGASSLKAQNNPADTLWEPGKTQIAYLALENQGNLDLKYVMALDVVDGGLIGALEYAVIDGARYGDINAASWADVKALANGQIGDVAAGTIIAAPNGAIKADEDLEYFALAVHMKETADNRYQGKDITIDVRVSATQLTSENDSFGNTYDAEADDLYLVDEASNKYIATTEKGLAAAAKLASSVPFDSVTYVTDEGLVEVPILRNSTDLQNAINAKTEIILLVEGAFQPDLYPNSIANDSLTIIGAGAGTSLRFKSQQVRADLYDQLTISNCTIDRMFTKSWGHVVFCNSKENGEYTISNCIFNGVGTQGIFINQNVAATFNIEDCTFIGDFGGEGAITVSNNDGANFTLNVTGCEFIDIPASSHEIYIQYAYNGWQLNAPGVSAYWKANP